MAKRWNPKPDAPIGVQEQVGRRIFDEPKLRGVEDQPELGILSVEHFREKRDPNVSLDRLGRSGIEPKVKKHLIPRCELQGKKFEKSKEFEGWAVIKVKDLVNKWAKVPQWEVHASPVEKQGSEEFSDNEYHAHANCSEENNDLGAALFLRHLFERYGQIEVVDQEGDCSDGRTQKDDFFASLRTWARRWIGK